MSIHNRIHASIINKYGKKIRNKQRGDKKERAICWLYCCSITNIKKAEN